MMKINRWGVPGLLSAWLVTAALVTLPAQPLRAQDDRTSHGCRCVDRDGNEIENCSCFRSFPLRGGDVLVRSLGDFGSRARLGVTVTTDQSATDDGRGARVTDVMPDGPAAEAGLREGDIITRLDGHDLREAQDAQMEEDFDLDRSIPVQRLLALARELEPGRDVEVEYLRDGESRRTSLTTEDLGVWGGLNRRGLTWGGSDSEAFSSRYRELGERLRSGVTPRTFGLVSPDDGGVGVWSSPHWNVGLMGTGGLELLELNPGLAGYFGTEGGVLVADVDPDSPLQLEPGDVIVRIGDRTVDSPGRVRRILATYEADEDIVFHIVRRDREMSVQGRPGR